MKVVASFDRWIKEANEGNAGSLLSLYDGLYNVGYGMAESLLEEHDARDEVVFSVFVEQWLKRDGFGEIEAERNALNLAVRERCKAVHKIGSQAYVRTWTDRIPVIDGYHHLMLDTIFKAELYEYERTSKEIRKALFYLLLQGKDELDIARKMRRTKDSIGRFCDNGLKYLIILRSSQAGRYKIV